MRLSTRKQFKQLEDRKNAMPKLEHPALQRLQECTSTYRKNTLGYLADQLRMPGPALVDQFKQAGFNGLTLEHKITDFHKMVLLGYLRSKRSSPPENLYSNEAPVSEQIVIVQEITDELLRNLSKAPDLIYNLDPRKFEELVARILEDNGCEVNLTKRTRDGGYDIFGRIKGSIASPVFLAECKRYAPHNKVGVEIVRGVYGVTELHKANLGLVITSSSFTKDAREEKIRIGERIDLKDFRDLCTWLKPYQRQVG